MVYLILRQTSKWWASISIFQETAFWMSFKGPHNIMVMALGHSVKCPLVVTTPLEMLFENIF